MAFALHQRMLKELVSIRPLPLLVVSALAGLAVGGAAAPRSAAISSAVPAAAVETAGAPIDFLGNEVRPAVARYQVDATGAWYEVHSPETEVPRLAPPEG